MSFLGKVSFLFLSQYIDKHDGWNVRCKRLRTTALEDYNK